MGKLFDTNFFTRLVSTFFIVSIFSFAVISGGFWFSFLILIITSVSYFEWFSMIIHKIQERKGQEFLKYLSLSGILGNFLILPFSISMLYLRYGKYPGSDKNSIIYIFFIAAVLASTDIGAYIFGKMIGGIKLWSKISPNKTVSGGIAGIFFSILTAILFKIFLKIGPDFLKMTIIGLVLSVLAQIGGLIMSVSKRHFHVKDSGKLIPGHGGFLDRIDSYFLSLPFFVFLMIFKFFN
jgi:CDP-diglyceride synthetase